jgi:hypothetical protein
LGHSLYENSGAGTFDLAEPAPGKTWVGDGRGGHWRINGKRWDDGQ